MSTQEANTPAAGDTEPPVADPGAATETGDTEPPGAAPGAATGPATVPEETNDTSDIIAAKRLLAQDYNNDHSSLNILAKGTNQAVRLITEFAQAATTIGEELQQTVQQGGYKRRKTKKQRTKKQRTKKQRTKKQTTKQRKKRRTRRV